MKNLLIIQARTGSSRLPNKVLKELCGQPMLQHIVNRVSKCKTVDKVIVATTVSKGDNAIEELCDRIDCYCYRGSENDVLDRYYQAAKLFMPTNVIRITADCPLIDSEIIDAIVQEHENGEYDYSSNTLVETFPDGLDAEVFKYSALETAWKMADLASEREHVTPFIKFKGDFKRFSFERTPSLADKRWTVDTDKDFEVVTQIYNALFKESENFTTEEILTFLEKNSEIEKLNGNIIRNEGYIKSVKNDHIIKGEV